MKGEDLLFQQLMEPLWRNVTLFDIISFFRLPSLSSFILLCWSGANVTLAGCKTAKWNLCEYVIVHTKLPPSPVILWRELAGKPKWLLLNFGYHDKMHTGPISAVKINIVPLFVFFLSVHSVFGLCGLSKALILSYDSHMPNNPTEQGEEFHHRLWFLTLVNVLNALQSPHLPMTSPWQRWATPRLWCHGNNLLG